MKKLLFTMFSLLASFGLYAQAGHIMQGVGAKNMSMGGAATGQALDISGALHWNPAAITTFEGSQFKLDIGIFFSDPELRSTVPEINPQTGQPTGNFLSGVTNDDRGASPMPALAFVWGKEGSRSKFGVSAFGISGFGVTFPESMTNPVNAPQEFGGFGRIESDYLLFQLGFTWAYQLTDRISFGIQPNFNFAALELIPNPTANPNASGYPSADRASAFGYGAQFAVYYESPVGFKAGVSYKTPQYFSDFNLDNTYLDNSQEENSFRMDYPSIFSVGLGYSLGNIDLALDYRLVNYENTEGFEKAGWTQTASVRGFGWKNINIISAGIQYKGINKLPLRVGYTYSSNPITSELAFFNIPATAIIKNAYQLGLSYEFGTRFIVDAVFHYGDSSGSTSGPALNPMFISNDNPYGAVPGTEVSYDMTTSMIQVGVSYRFN
ncbi:OmpP1/FadL family transporter [Robertkochia flava]|uniref:OmpP1/FadL family transporter n=1 Tax=Robertkochia flava TaxID=3447986 RepID=UPI001CCA8B1A|nr:outer membrane protein transport protein [Robertkochia marina]